MLRLLFDLKILNDYNMFMDIQKTNELIDKNKTQFEKFYSFLIDYNKKINLTAITEKEDVFVKHFLDSILPVNQIKENAYVIDIGTGAGFPGIPLKIVRDDIKLTLLDSLNKRVEFLKQVSKILEIDTTCVHARAEDFCRLNREKFDVGLSRAVAPLNTLVEYVLPVVKVGGIMLAYKGNNAVNELKNATNAINLLGGKFVKTIHFNLPNNAGERNIIVIKKVNKTPAEYPRGQNKPKLKPLI